MNTEYEYIHELATGPDTFQALTDVHNNKPDFKSIISHPVL